MLDSLLTGGKLVLGGSICDGNIGIKGGKIVEILDPTIKPEALRTIDANGNIIIPGPIDAHVHYQNVLSLSTDTAETTSIAAAHGGITTIIPFLYASRVEQTMVKSDTAHRAPQTAGLNAAECLESVIKENQKCSVVDFAVHWSLLPDEALIRQIPEVRKLGIVSFKMVQGYPPWRGLLLSDDLVMTAMEMIAENGGIAMVHAENGYVSGYLEEKFASKGLYTAEHYLDARPSLSEAEAIYKAICLSEITNCPLYIVHVSTKLGLQNIMRSKSENTNVTAETCPPYLLLTREDQVKGDKLLKISPPLRLAEDTSALWLGLRQGFISVVASDHVGWDRDSMKLAAPSYRQTPNNFPGVETLLPLLYSEGVVKNRMTLAQMVRVLCENPARIFGLYPRKGVIAIGADADLTAIDPTVEWEIRGEKLHSAARYDAYEGWRVKGKPVLSLLRGEILLKDGQIQQAPGFGQFVRSDSIQKNQLPLA